MNTAMKTSAGSARTSPTGRRKRDVIVRGLPVKERAAPCPARHYDSPYSIGFLPLNLVFCSQSAASCGVFLPA